MSRKWLTYLSIISLVLLWSCSASDNSPEVKEEKSVLADDTYVEGESASYAEAAEEAATEETGEVYEHSKDAIEEESYTVINSGQLIALQGRAEQKVNELFEYITIMSNDGYDIEMRKNAKKMAVNLFVEKAKLYAPSITGVEDSVTVKSVLKGVLKGEIKLDGISIEDIDVADDEAVYCKLRVNNVGFRLFFKVNMEFESKQFGDESLQVWTVYLGDVNED